MVAAVERFLWDTSAATGTRRRTVDGVGWSALGGHAESEPSGLDGWERAARLDSVGRRGCGGWDRDDAWRAHPNAA